MKKHSAILGAAFLMATSAIGPGFLTQTSLFTSQLLTSFGFVILLSILIDIGVQLNIWRTITMKEKRAQDLANSVFPGMGVLLAILIGIGGLIFNIGNIAGAGLGLNVLTGVNAEWGALISCVIALSIFWSKHTGRYMDMVVKILGLAMIVLTLYVAIASQPPVLQALHHTIWPEQVDFLMIITIVGGTVGGYISFAGAHRLLDAGIKGPAHLPEVNHSAVSGILITATMRYILFLAALGVVWGGVTLASDNPASTVFQQATGKGGYLFFGIVLWSAAITSVIGASYTTVSFWKTLSPFVLKHEKMLITVFILISTAIFMFYGRPVRLLVMAGAVNGLILPLALALILWSAMRKDPTATYRHPVWMTTIGWLIVGVMGYMGYQAIVQEIARLGL